MMSYLRGWNRVTDRIVVFNGSKRDFDNYLNNAIENNSGSIPFMELIQHYNARIRPSESGVKEADLHKKIQVENCIVRADDYSSVLPHVLSNFANIVALNYDIDTLYIQNPPRRVLESLETSFAGAINYEYSVYPSIGRKELREIYRNISLDVLGQESCKKHLLSGLYRLTTGSTEKPVVLMLYGPSGVGKTESAKSISKSLGGKLLRIQFSMMQNQESIDYIFGADHSKNSFARDMLGRESNVIIIDEFDKVNPHFYNAFYELFDEGRYVDTNYDLNLKQAIFLLTCNYNNEQEIKTALGPAMFSRIGCCIKFDELSTDQKRTIITNWYKEILDSLQSDEKAFIETTNVLEWFIKNASRYDNIRTLKTKLENAVFDKLTEHYILGKYSNDSTI